MNEAHISNYILKSLYDEMIEKFAGEVISEMLYDDIKNFLIEEISAKYKIDKNLIFVDVSVVDLYGINVSIDFKDRSIYTYIYDNNPEFFV